MLYIQIIPKLLTPFCTLKLVKVLTSFGINKTVVNWIENFLRIRYQHVVIGDAISEPLLIHSGVPQGSVIGPLVFNIFINNITVCSQPLHNSGDLFLFADDAKVLSTDNNNLQLSLDLVSQWSASRQLKLAPSKCYSLPISKSFMKFPPSTFSINQTVIPSTSCFKDLGDIFGT